VDRYVRSGTPVGRTSWRRFGVAAGLALTAAVGVVVLQANSVLAAGFMVSGQQFKVSADSLDGTGFVNYGWVDQQADGSAVPVAVAGIKHATLRNMCQSVLTSLPIIGDVSLKITAGTGATPVTAENLFIDMTQMDGNAEFTNIEIGRDASTLDKGPPGAQGLQGLFGQQSTAVHITDLRQTAWASHAGTFRLSGLRMSLRAGKHECFD
jgi:Family of unknown function (DUF6230)